MLIQFRVENHRSLRDEQVLSMVAADDLDPDDKRLIRRDGLDVALLPAVALYGANASGKSNVLGALGFMRDAVLRSHRLWEPESGTPQEPFALSAKVSEPSLYEVDILLGGTRYRYGFVISAARVEEEWLYAWPQGIEELWFEREEDRFTFGEVFAGENETIRELTRSNSLFLSAAAQNNHAAILPIFKWFRTARLELRRVPAVGVPNAESAILEVLFSRQLSLFPEEARQRDRDAIVRLLRAADVGILDIRVTGQENAHPGYRVRSGLRRQEVFFLHKAEGEEQAWLPLEAESSGTVMLLRIAASLVGVLRAGTLLCIDELEASLHPTLALELVRLFNDPSQNPQGAQLVFTTHDTNLLGNIIGEPALRRDQIWFTEKDQNGATHLYPLTDFHRHEEENLERGYLQGRYGAVPFLGRLSSILMNQEDG